MNRFLLNECIYDPSLSRISSYFTQLFIKVGMDHFQYTILDTEKNSYIAMADYRAGEGQTGTETWMEEIGRLFLADEHLNRKYPAIICSIDTPYKSVVPSPMFDRQGIEDHLRYNFSLPEGLNLHADHLSGIDAWLAWAVSPEVEKIILHHFPNAKLLHSASPLLGPNSENMSRDMGKSYMHLEFIGSRFNLAVFSQENLLIFNTYSFEKEEDVLYFSLYALEQLKMRTGDVNVHLSGDIETSSSISTLLREYLPNLIPANRPGGFLYSPLFEFPQHRYFTLFNLALCGS